MAKYFYRFDTSSELGKKFRSINNECNKAERAAEVFAKKCGAKTYYSSPAAFAGGVECVSFADTSKVNKKIWQSLGPDADGIEQWAPAVSSKSDVLILPRRNFRPSNTVNRIYDSHVLPWSQVRHLHTLEEWAAMVAMRTTDNRAKDAERLDGMMADMRFVKYIELTCDGEDVAPQDKRRSVSHVAREAVRIERARMLLPVVRIEQIYQLLQVDHSSAAKDGHAAFIHDTTPIIFEYNRRIYVGINYPCRAEDMKEMGSVAFMDAMNDYNETKRNLEALEKGGVN